MKENVKRRSLVRRLLRYALWVMALVLAVFLARCLYVFRDRNPGYSVAINLDGRASKNTSRPFQAGFGRVKINPDITNLKQPVWLAGFSQHRAATAIHDDLWAAACVLDDGYTRLGIVAMDAIGFFHDDVIAVRRQLAAEWKLNYTIICTTHNHSTPDLMGLWGPDFLHSGVNPQYRQQVINAAAKALGNALAALQAAKVAFHEIPTLPAGLVADTRKPEVFDSDIRVMHFLNPTNGATIGSIVNWADHPETVWSQNTEITADFPGYVRDGLENGVRRGTNMVAKGLGGIHLYINGAIGGLMSTIPRLTVQDPYSSQNYEKPTHDKARALGNQLISRILPKLSDTNIIATNHLPIAIQARTLELPLANTGFLLAPIIGLLDRGHVHWKMMRTEVALVSLGDASIACIPGEIYPEIVNGGIEKAPGGDFQIDPVEVPPIRALMPGKIKFVFGMANDEIGYIIPKSEWDERPPYLYDSKHGVYGEINSLGPETAGQIHGAFKNFGAQITK